MRDLLKLKYDACSRILNSGLNVITIAPTSKVSAIVAYDYKKKNPDKQIEFIHIDYEDISTRASDIDELLSKAYKKATDYKFEQNAPQLILQISTINMDTLELPTPLLDAFGIAIQIDEF